MDVTLLGILIVVNPLHPLKTPLRMVVTLLGMIVFLHPEIKVFDEVSMMALQLLRESYF